MALISVTGGTSTQRSLAQEVAYWALDQLVSRRMQNSLDIRIEIKPFVNEGNNVGYTTWEYDNIRPREFLIEIDKSIDDEEFTETIIHEMVHVKQFAKEELKERFKPYLRELWFGKEIDTKNKYRSLPWEKDAYKLQVKLYNEYICS